MKLSRWLIAFVLLALSQQVGIVLVELLFVSQVDPYINQEIRTRFEEPATRWHEQAQSATDDLDSLLADIEKETNTGVFLATPNPIAEIDGTGIDGIYYALLEVPGIYLTIMVDDETDIDIGPMPGTFLLTSLPTMVPMLVNGFLAFVVLFMTIRTELRPVRTAAHKYPNSGLQPGSTVRTLMKQFAVLHEKNSKLEAAAERNIENQRDFLHGVAHEFRAPLARLRFAVDLDEPDKTERVDAILEDMDDLVTEILQYSRYRHGLFDVNFESLDLTNLLSQVTESLVDQNRIEIVRGPGMQSAHLVNNDAALLERCIKNLVLNADRFARSKILIDIEDGDETVCLVIEDDGPGVPPGKRDLIFDAFTRLDPSRDRTSGGTGLGLAIVAGIAKKLGAFARATDASIGGAQFRIELPRDLQVYEWK